MNQVHLPDFWNMGILNLLFGYSVANILYNIMSSAYVIIGDYKKNLSLSVLYTFSSILLSIILCFYVFADERFMARLIGNALPLILISSVLTIRCLLTHKSYICYKYWRYAISMGFPLIFHSLSLIVMQQADNLMVNAYIGAEAAGIYSLASTISVILIVLQSSIDSAWAPWFYENIYKSNYSVLIENNDKILYLFAGIVSFVNIISPELIRITAPLSYSDAIYVLLPLNLSIYVSFMYIFSVNKEYFYKKTKFIAVGTFVATAVDIVLNIFFIPRVGLIAAAYTTLVSKILLFFIHHYISGNIDSRNVISNKAMYKSTFFVIVSFILSLYLVKCIFIRFTLLLILLLVGVIYIKDKKDINIYHFLKK